MHIFLYISHATGQAVMTTAPRLAMIRKQLRTEWNRKVFTSCPRSACRLRIPSQNLQHEVQLIQLFRC